MAAISILLPCLNAREFLEARIDSLSQPNLLRLGSHRPRQQFVRRKLGVFPVDRGHGLAFPTSSSPSRRAVCGAESRTGVRKRRIFSRRDLRRHHDAGISGRRCYKLRKIVRRRESPRAICNLINREGNDLSLEEVHTFFAGERE